ncbi:MAG: SDR family oxidoreductase [Planctomycetales bacterium]|nr:SDR family oxidoreductase [Planctomycetales bacterium]
MKRIVITGVSRGLGRAMADGFRDAGHVVIGCSRSKSAINRLRDEFGEPHRFDTVDVADHANVEAWAESVVASHGPPDILINNAALINETTELWNVPVDEFSELFAVNVNGTFYTIRNFVPAMIENGSGVIVNFSSGWGRSTSPEVAPYCATKWAIEGLTSALAQELPRGFVAVALNPGVINTDMLQTAWGSSADGYQDPEAWATKAVPLILSLGPKDSGQQLSVP